MSVETLIDTYGATYDALRLTTGDTIAALWADLGGPDELRALEFAEAAVDVVNAAAQETAIVVDAYVAEYVGTVTGKASTGPSTLDLAEFVVDQLRGTPGLDVYRRPAITARTALADGRSFEEAMSVAGSRASAMAQADIGLAHRQAAVESMDANPDVDGYRRTLTGASCLLCMIASTQRYKTSALMPIHTRCDCRVAPLVDGTDYGRVINRELYRELKAQGAMDKITRGRIRTREGLPAQRTAAQARRQKALDKRASLEDELAAETDPARRRRLEERIERESATIVGADRQLKVLGTGPTRVKQKVTGPVAPVDWPDGMKPAAPTVPAVREHGELGPVLVNDRHAYTTVTPSTAAAARVDADPDTLRASDPPPPAKVTTSKPASVPDSPDTPPTAPAAPKPARKPRYSVDSPEVLRRSQRKNISPQQAADQLNDKAARRSAEQAATRREARALTVDSPEVVKVADRYGVSPAEVMVARERVREVRRVIADEAARVQARSFADLDLWDALKITRPPKAGARSAVGRKLRGGEYDWLERLGDRERARLSRAWYTDVDAYTPDLLAEAISSRLGRDVSVDDAVALWLDRNRTIEAAGALRRGKLPSLDAYSGSIDPDDLLPEFSASGYRVTAVLGDDLEAAAHIAQVEREVLRRDAEQYLGRALEPELGPAPWRMSYQSWEEEVLELEYAVRNRLDAEIRVGDDMVTFTAEEAADRLEELVPYYLDEPGTSFEELYARIIVTANRANLEVADYARIPWS